MKRKTLQAILFKPELRSLGGGKRWSNLMFLTLIYAFALFILGAGEQIEKFLKEKMDDPYVKLLVAEIPNTSCDESKLSSEILNNQVFKDRFKIKDAQPMAKTYLNCRGLNNAVRSFKVGAYDKAEHPLWSIIESDPTLFLTEASRCNPFDHRQKSGVILSEYAAIELGVWPLPKDTFPHISWIEKTGINSPGIDLPILGVTKSLPLDLQVTILDTTLIQLNSGSSIMTQDYFYLPEEKKNKDLSSGTKIPGGSIYSTMVSGDDANFLNENGQLINLLHLNNVQGDLDREYLLFQVDDLTKVRDLADELRKNKRKYGVTKAKSGALEIDLTDVESKNNLGIFSRFAFLLSTALVVIALILIINYTGAILRLHINKNKRNLGTLTAFGYENSTITLLYLLITATILGLSFAISYALVWTIGYFGFTKFLELSNLSDVDVSFAHIPLYFSVPLFVLLPLIIVSYRIRKQLKATPGDLVYDR